MERADAPAFEPSGFFVLRTPLLPFDELLRVTGGDAAEVRRSLQALARTPEIREALFVASPSLDEALERWFRDPDGERGQRAEQSVFRYFSRMTSRPTPFGLLAGYSHGQIGGATTLRLAGRETYRRRSRLDMDFLSTLARSLERDPAVQPTLLCRPNSSIYPSGGRLRYVESRVDGNSLSHELVAVEAGEHLSVVLERAGGGAMVDDLAAALVQHDAGLSLDDAAGFIAELIDAGVLVTELAPPLTGGEPAAALADALRRRGHSTLSDALTGSRRRLEALDQAGFGNEPAAYRAMAQELEAAAGRVDLSRLYQIDISKPASELRLGDEVIGEISRAARVLHRLWLGADDNLRRFREAFAERYERREVPLVEVLDEESGIGFAQSRDADAPPLVAGLHPEMPAATPTVPWRSRETLLLGKLLEATAAGATEIVVSDADIDVMANRDIPPLPDAFAVHASIAAADEDAIRGGDFRIAVEGISGPSGAKLFARFCDMDAGLQARVEDHLRAEERHRPDAIYADVVHLPEGRHGNVLARPVLRAFEIPYVGVSGAPHERQIPVTDLLVSIEGSRVVLRSASLDREVIPRLTSAHNYQHYRSIGIYRFLCLLQTQDVATALSWSWGVLENAAFLPRVRYGRTVLSLARWRLVKEDLAQLRGLDAAALPARIEALRAARGIPRFVTTNDFLVDLESPLSIATMLSLTKADHVAVLEELFPGADELCVRGPEGRFVHELIVPFVARSTAAEGRTKTAGRMAGPVRRSFAPGSEWLYAKLYCGTATADTVIESIVRPLAERSMSAGAADRWFFLRYGDPSWHVRVRFHGQPARLASEILPALHEAAGVEQTLLSAGSRQECLLYAGERAIWRMQLDTYEREIERYGGPNGIELVEELFRADSEAVVGLLSPEDADDRWLIALRGVDSLLDELELDLAAKRAVVGRLAQSFGARKQAVKIRLGDRFRQRRKEIEAMFREPLPGPLAARAAAAAPVVRELRAREAAGALTATIAELAPSLAHMHVNRLIRSAHASHELVLYDFLDRVYESRSMRR